MTSRTTNFADGYVLRISLEWSDPEIWRTFCIPADFSLGDLHDLIQIIMGWENDHLHDFVYKKTRIGEPEFEYDDILNEWDVSVSSIFKRKGSSIRYTYDFGDSWMHNIVSQGKMKKGDPMLQVIDGSGACPPEDSGGIYGYYHKLECLKDKNHPDHEFVVDWMGDDFDPDAFDIAAINAELRESYDADYFNDE